MPIHDIGRMLIGSCQLKKVSSLVNLLNCGVNQICKMLQGVRVHQLPEPSRAARVRREKTRFLARLWL